MGSKKKKGRKKSIVGKEFSLGKASIIGPEMTVKVVRETKDQTVWQLPSGKEIVLPRKRKKRLKKLKTT